MLSPKSTRVLKKVFPYTVIWFLGSLLYVIIERGLLGDATHYPSTGNIYNSDAAFIMVLSLGLFLGTFLGLIEEGLVKRTFRKAPFITKLLFKTLAYTVIMAVSLGISATIVNSIIFGLPVSDPVVLDSVINFVGHYVFLSGIAYLGAAVGISLFFSEMVDHIGMNAVINFFTGKYSKSKEEDRVFLFLDMRSSTSIAEKLGHREYYQLLNSYYEDMTSAVIATAGEIYQYVGDEMVVSWKYQQGIKNNNCIKCFFLIKEKLKRRRDFYQSQFGLVPEFKAGLHCGKVSTGEVGLIKKEILFTGDVLNTTSRIQNMCNELHVDILISEELIDNLTLEEEFTPINKGSFELRGRDRQVALFTVDPILTWSPN